MVRTDLARWKAARAEAVVAVQEAHTAVEAARQALVSGAGGPDEVLRAEDALRVARRALRQSRGAEDVVRTRLAEAVLARWGSRRGWSGRGAAAARQREPERRERAAACAVRRRNVTKRRSET